MSQAPAATAGQSIDRLVQGFESEIAPVRVSIVYRLGLAVVAIVMLVLPLIYVGLIAAVSFGLYYHATENLAIFGTEGSLKVKVFVYITPLIVGAILILFMIKPLFARRVERTEPLSLNAADEPTLFAFIERLCSIVGAPFPSRIDVDCEVNASASLRRGIRSLLGNDLVLTIGMPLVAGLNLQQLTGVLAHEFGHFAQGGGMRLTYVIRTVNAWFARVVYERDVWDVCLQEWALGLTLHLSRFFVWVTRKILWVLMMAGHAVSCFMMRQMEFDADRYEARVSGSETFTSTALRLQVLGVANQQAFQTLACAWHDRRLADDLPHLIHSNLDRLPDELYDSIVEHLRAGKTGAFDTHPADIDRMISARHEDAEGVFRLQEPATVLFHDFGALSKRVTTSYYCEQFERDVPSEWLLPVASIVADQRDSDSAMEALARYFQGAISDQALFWPDESGLDGSPAREREAWELLQEARQTMEHVAPSLCKIVDDAERLSETEVEASVAMVLMRSKFQIDAEVFHLRQASEAAAEEALISAAQERRWMNEALSKFHQAATRRLTASRALLNSDTAREQIESAQELTEDMESMQQVLDALRPVFHEIGSFMKDQASLGALLQILEDNQHKHAAPDQLLCNLHKHGVKDQLLSLTRARHAFLQTIREIDTLHPFEGDGVSIGMHAVAGLQRVEQIAKNHELREIYLAGEICKIGEQAGHRLLTLYFRSLGKLVDTAMRVEVALGMTPSKLPDPQSEA